MTDIYIYKNTSRTSYYIVKQLIYPSPSPVSTKINKTHTHTNLMQSRRLQLILSRNLLPRTFFPFH